MKASGRDWRDMARPETRHTVRATAAASESKAGAATGRGEREGVSCRRQGVAADVVVVVESRLQDA